MTGIVILADTDTTVKIGVVDKITHYPTWLAEKREYNPNNYPKADYVYGLEVTMQKGINILGWEEDEEINYANSNRYPGKPHLYVRVQEDEELRQYQIINTDKQIYSLSSETDPRCQHIVQIHSAHAFLSVLKNNCQPMSLFSASYLLCMPDFYGQRMQKFDFGAIKGMTTVHKFFIRK
jgi:hypothetical protein